jgi:hypothetical protein
MFSWLKKVFIPHEANDHRPHALRSESVRYFFVFIIFLEIFTFLIPMIVGLNQTSGMAAVLPAILSDLTNEQRQTQKLPVLATSPLLTKAAQLKAEDMATKGYFAHTSPEGKTPWYWIDQVGYQYQYAGENLAINFTDSIDVVKAWMNSPSHRANILKDKYTEVGTGIATGLYQGQETIFVAQMYANPIPLDTSQNSTNKVITNNTNKITPVVANNKNENTSVLGAQTENIVTTQKPTTLQKTIASPHNNSNKILFFISGLIVLALLLNIFIEIKHHHLDLITNGLIMIVLIGAVFLVNNYLSSRNMIVLDSVYYSK